MKCKTKRFSEITNISILRAYFSKTNFFNFLLRIMQICIFLSSFASHYYILKGTITVLMEFHFMYQLVYNHYFKKGIFSSLCALEAKNSKSVPFTELSRLPNFTLQVHLKG